MVVAVERKRTNSLGGDLRSRWIVGVLGIVLLGTLVACESTPADRNEVIALVNRSRAEAGLPPVRENFLLDRKADAWAQHLRDVCDLSHSDLKQGAPPNWHYLGENVGYGGTIAQIHEAYLRSPGHRENILDPSFEEMGAAAVWGTCPDGSRRVFTVQEFMEPR